nr:DUF3987 domain-containing protein [Burkholderia metallica]
MYPVDALPPVIRNAVREVSGNLDVPAVIAAHTALGVVSLACQNFISVQCPNYPPAPCALFLWTISNTSGGKSLMEQRFLREVVAFESKSKEGAAARMSDYKAELKIWNDDERRLSKEYRDAEPGSEQSTLIRERRLLHEKTRPIKPEARELRYADLSPQGLRDALIANGAIGILSPEAGPAINGMTFSQPAMLCGYWSGEDRPVALVSGSRRADAPRLTMSVSFQDDRFREYMKNRGADAFGAGLLARILPAFPMTFDWNGQQTTVSDVPEPALDLFNSRVAEILAQPATEERKVRQLTDGARHYWKLFREAVHRDLICSDHSENIKSFFRKLAEQAARIAGLFHYFDGKPGDVSAEAMKSAIALCEWYAHEFFRIFSEFAPSQQQMENEVAQKLLAWLQEAFANPVRYSKLRAGQYSERDLNNYSPIRNDPANLALAIDVLQRQGLIATAYGKKGGRVVFYPPYMAQHFQQAGFGVQPMNCNTANQFIVPSNMPSTWRTYVDSGLGNQFGTSNMPFNNPPDQGSASVDTIPACQGTNAGGVSAPQSGQSHAERHDSPRMTMEFDSDELRAVKRHIEKKAMEEGLGQVSLSVKYHNG